MTSVRDCVRCDTVTKKGAQCTRSTCKYYKHCWQHAQKATGLKLAPSNIPNSGDGLFTKKRFKKGQIIVPYTGQAGYVMIKAGF